MQKLFGQCERIAIHEAGHAVAHSRLGIFQACVSIDPVEVYDKDGNPGATIFGRSIAKGAEQICEAGDVNTTACINSWAKCYLCCWPSRVWVSNHAAIARIGEESPPRIIAYVGYWGNNKAVVIR